MQDKEQDKEFLFFLQNNWLQTQNEVKLRLYKPRLNYKKISLPDLFYLQQKCPAVRRFLIEQTQSEDQQTILLCFDSVEDALDFQHQFKQELSYKMSLIQQQNSISKQKRTTFAYEPLRLQQQIQQQGFQIQNGLIRLKKITSVEELIKENLNIQQQLQQSTFMHTQRKISIDSDIQQHKQEQRNNQKKKTQTIQQKKQDNFLKPLFDGLLTTGAIYGGFKLLKYLIKF